MAKLIGEWTIDWDQFARWRYPASLDELVTSHAPNVLGGGIVDDFTARVDEDRQSCDPYLRILPFGSNSTAVNDIIQDGDILSFVRPTLHGKDAVELFQQRGWHAEVCYKKDGVAYQCAPWNDRLGDKSCSEGDAPCYGQTPWIIHIFRTVFSDVLPDHVAALKRQVILWKQIFASYRFPADNDLYPGSKKYFDPADFGSVPEVEGLAQKLILKSPDVPKVTCVQWAYQVLCLSLCVPLNERTLTRLGVYDVFRTNWPDLVDITPPDVDSARRLPFVPHSPAQVVQDFLDVYANGLFLLEALKSPSIKAFLKERLEMQKLPGFQQAVMAYLDEVVQFGDISRPLKIEGKPPYRFVLPITFFCEARTASKKQPNEPWFRYVGTMIHESLVNRIE